jgi:hypothetical protein
LKGWTKSPAKKFITSDKAFGVLFKKNVSFFDVDAHVVSTIISVKGDLAESKKTKLATSASIDDFDFDIEDLTSEDEHNVWIDY